MLLGKRGYPTSESEPRQALTQFIEGARRESKRRLGVESWINLDPNSDATENPEAIATGSEIQP
jgi:hypothetical protein